jgi:hypothetical protein
MRDFAHPFIGLHGRSLGQWLVGHWQGNRITREQYQQRAGPPPTVAPRCVELRTMKPTSLGGPRGLAARRAPLPQVK